MGRVCCWHPGFAGRKAQVPVPAGREPLVPPGLAGRAGQLAVVFDR
jgi:hypothetical protein